MPLPSAPAPRAGAQPEAEGEVERLCRQPGGKGGEGVQRQESVGHKKGTASPGTESERLGLPWRPSGFTFPASLHRSCPPQPALPQHTATPPPPHVCTRCSSAWSARPLMLTSDQTQVLSPAQFLPPLGLSSRALRVPLGLGAPGQLVCPPRGLPQKAAQVACASSNSNSAIHTDDEGMSPTWIRGRLTSLPTLSSAQRRAGHKVDSEVIPGLCTRAAGRTQGAPETLSHLSNGRHSLHP